MVEMGRCKSIIKYLRKIADKIPRYIMYENGAREHT